MIYRPIAIAIFLGVMVGACTTAPTTQAETGITKEADKLKNDFSDLKARLSKFLTDLANRTSEDLQHAVDVANAAVPVDTAGVNCYTALINEQAAIRKFLAAVKTTDGTGTTGGQLWPIRDAEIATLLLPGSPQTNAVRDALVQGCAVKVAQVSNEIAGGAAWFDQIGGLLALAPK